MDDAHAAPADLAQDAEVPKALGQGRAGHGATSGGDRGAAGVANGGDHGIAEALQGIDSCLAGGASVEVAADLFQFRPGQVAKDEAGQLGGSRARWLGHCATSR